MRITKATLDKVLATAGAVASAALPGLVDANVLSAGVAASIGGGLAVLVAGYHGGAAAAGRLTEPAVKAL